MIRTLRRLLFSGAWLLLVPPLASAQSQPSIGELSIEQLFDIQVERVFGASRRLQPVTEAPSSVTIITSEEIERMGYRTLADILRGVRGLQVTYDRNYSYLGTRGLSVPGDYNTRILLLVDGHRMNDNIYDQAAIGADFGLDPVTFQRVEIIRGPSSSLYGTSAFFGVVNVITKSGAGVNGVTASAEAGSLGLQGARVVAGTKLANGLDVLLSATAQRSDGVERLYVPAFDTPATSNGVATGLDDERFSQAFGRLTLRNWTLSGAIGQRDKRVPTASFHTLFNDPRLRTSDRRGYLDLTYQRSLATTRLDARVYLDDYGYQGDYPEQPSSEPWSLYHDYARGTWWGVDARAARSLPARQTLTAGVEYRRHLRQDQGANYTEPFEVTFDSKLSSDTVGAYLQDEIALHRKVSVSGGLRFDRYPHFARVTPRAALIVRPSRDRALKYLYGQAFRAPNAYELGYYEMTGPLTAERIDSHEVVWEEYLGHTLRTSVSGYFNHVYDLIALDGDGAENYWFVNDGRVDTWGSEFETEVKLRWGLHALASYAIQEGRNRLTDAGLTNAPRHTAKGRVLFPVGGRGGSIGVELLYASRRATLNGTRVPHTAAANLSVIRPLSSRLALTGRITNALDRRNYDPGSEEHIQDRIEQDGRTFTIGLRWTPKR